MQTDTPSYLPLPFHESHYKISHPAPVDEDAVGPPEIPSEEIIYDKERDFLGEGAFGKVYKGKCRGKDVAIKVPIKQRLTEEELKAFRHEVQIMRKIFHPNVVLFLGASTAENNLKIVTELMETDLEKIIHSGKQLTLPEKIRYAKDAALGMNWLHGICSIIHRDLKPANLLVDKHNVVKVTDFGFSQLKPQNQLLNDKLGPKGTALYMAPEVMSQSPFDFKADVYSFGLILWELYTQQELFIEYDDWDPFFDAIVMQSKRPDIPSTCIESLSFLMQKCWAHDPEERPTFKEVLFRLDEILVDSVLCPGEGKLYIEEARSWWKQHFLLPTQSVRESIPWKDFAKILATQAKVSVAEFEKIKILLAIKPDGSLPSDEPVVTLERFSQVLIWFGPFFLTPDSTSIISEMKSLLSNVWFHYDISKDLAEKRLFQREPGTFLVRLSNTHPSYPYTISKIGSDKTFQHKRVKHDADGFSVPVRSGGSKTFKSMQELVKYPELGLLKPCPQNQVDWNPYADDN